MDSHSPTHPLHYSGNARAGIKHDNVTKSIHNMVWKSFAHSGKPWAGFKHDNVNNSIHNIIWNSFAHPLSYSGNARAGIKHDNVTNSIHKMISTINLPSHLTSICPLQIQPRHWLLVHSIYAMMMQGKLEYYVNRKDPVFLTSSINMFSYYTPRH